MATELCQPYKITYAQEERIEEPQGGAQHWDDHTQTRQKRKKLDGHVGNEQKWGDYGPEEHHAIAVRDAPENDEILVTEEKLQNVS